MREPHAEMREISIEEFDEMIENHDDLLVVDVRDAAEFHRGHIPGAFLIPNGSLDDVTANQLFPVRMKTLVLCSQDGSGCAALASKLRLLGFEKVCRLAGGINRWQAQGYALVTE